MNENSHKDVASMKFDKKNSQAQNNFFFNFSYSWLILCRFQLLESNKSLLKKAYKFLLKWSFS